MNRKYPLSDNEILENNYFKDWSINQLHNLWIQFKFFYANGFTEPNSLLDNLREEFIKRCEPGLGIIMLEKEYLTAVVVKSFCACNGCKYLPDCPSEVHCINCSRMYNDRYEG